jgi:DNA-binding winged helix-turn-helix (wHTH) protein/TolB-like protein/Tfp pilus assembly protein PilF
MTKPDKHFYEFGPFRVDPQKRLLLGEKGPVALAPKAYELLLVLVENQGRVLDKGELMRRVWPDQIVEEANLTVNISALRKALGESPNERRFIVTVPGRGYKFVEGVREVGDESAAPSSEERTRSRGVLAGEEGREPERKSPVEAQTAAPPAAPRPHRRTPGLTAFAIALLGVGLAATAFYLWTSSRPQTAGGGAPVRSIAVLPFRPLAAEGRDEALELGMADTLIFRLSAVRGLVVRPVSAVRKYADLNQDPLAAGREQQVEAVLDSTIQTVGGKVRVTSRLVRVADGAVLWADWGEGSAADLFAVQDAIAERLAGPLALKLSEEERGRLTRRYTGNAEAYQLYLRGRYFSEKRTRDSLTKGVECFRQAIEQDPDYALAYAGLADTYMLLRRWAFAPVEETVPRARAAAEKALRLDDSLAEAHTALARVKEHSLDWSGAGAEYRRAIELNPSNATAHHLYAMHLAAVGRLDEALAEIRRAQELDPLSLIINMEVGRIFFFRHQYDEAIAQLRKTLELDPDFELARMNLGAAYEQKGMYEGAIAEYQKMIPGRRLGALGRVYALSGKTREAQKVLDELKEQSKKRFVSPVGMAVIHAGLGENGQAIAQLERALDEGEADLLYFLGVHPTWDGLRPEPRFKELLRRMGLPQ